MDNKIIAFATALVLSTSVCVAPAITVSAAPEPLQVALMAAFDDWDAGDEVPSNGQYVGTNGTILKKSEDETHIVVSSVNTGDYSAAAFQNDLLVESNVTINNSDDYSVSTRSTTELETKVVLDMGKVGAVYSDYTTLADNLAQISDDIDDNTVQYAQVKGSFTIEVTIPSGLTFADSTFTSTPLKGFSFANDSRAISEIFTETNRDYNPGTGVLSITIEVDKSKAELDEYFNGENTPDIVLSATLNAPAPVSSQESYLIKGSMTGNTTISSRAGVKLGYVEYRAIQDDTEIDANTEIITDTDVFVTEEITINRSTGGGGGGITYYTVKFESNGGTAVSGQSVAHNAKVPMPADPTYEGRTFEGWYTDEALTTLYNFNTPVTKNITLYAKWTEGAEPTPTPTPTPIAPSHPVPDDLNGDDHFAYIIGYPEGDVRPTNNITRAEVATIFFRLLKDEVRDSNLTQENVFLDVNEGDWYNVAISTLSKLGILNGRTDVEFEPNSFITRAEFATIAARFDDSEYGISDDFSDVAEHWAEEYIHEAADYGWITGYEDGTFRPDKLIIRAEAMTIINRVLQRVPENTQDLLDDMVKWSDNLDTSKWYYIAVQEATNSHDCIRKESNFEKWTQITAPRDWTTYEK